MKQGYTVRGKIENKGAGDPVNKGQVKQKVGVDLDIIAPDGHELTSDEVIAEGLAWLATIDVTNANGEVVARVKGVGATDRRFTDDPKGNGTRIGKAIPRDGYILEGGGSSALEASNGLRVLFNFKQQDEGVYTITADVDGEPARFPGGNTIGFGNAERRRREAEGRHQS